MNQPVRLPTAVRGLAAVSLLNDVASEMVYPLLPALVTTLGGGAMALGAIDGASELTLSALRWWSGKLADRPAWRGRLVLLGYGLAGLARPVMALVGAAWQVVAVRVVDRVGKGLRSPARDAMIADLAPPGMVGRAFGLHRSADHLGAVLGSLLGFELLRRGLEPREVVALSWLPGLAVLVVLAAVLALKGPARAELTVTASDAGPGATPLPKPLWWLAALAALRLPETLLLLRLQQLGAAPAVIPLLWALLHIVRSAVSYPSGRVTDRLGARPALGLAVASYAILIATIGLVSNPTVAIAAFLLHGVVAGVAEPAERAAIARMMPTRRGGAFGGYQAVAGVGALLSGLAFGWLYQHFGAERALPLAAAMSLIPWLGWSVAGQEPPAPNLPPG